MPKIERNYFKQDVFLKKGITVYKSNQTFHPMIHIIPYLTLEVKVLFFENLPSQNFKELTCKWQRDTAGYHHFNRFHFIVTRSEIGKFNLIRNTMQGTLLDTSFKMGGEPGCLSGSVS